MAADEGRVHDAEFHLTEWRRPFAYEGWWNTLQLMLLGVPFGALLVAGSLMALSVPAKAAVLLGAVFAVGGLAAALWWDQRRHPAGTLRIQGGRLTFSAWAGRRWDVPAAAVRVMAIQQKRVPVLAIHLSRAPPIFVHQPRTSVPLDEIQSTIFEHLGVPREAAPRKATPRETVGIYGHMLRRRWWILAVILGLYFLMVWLRDRLPLQPS